jgi:hypothetical protein
VRGNMKQKTGEMYWMRLPWLWILSTLGNFPPAVILCRPELMANNPGKDKN